MEASRTDTGNIGARGCRRRRLGGYLWSVITVVALAAMIALRAPRGTLLWLALPIAVAALGFLQARERTCVVHAVFGTRENDDGVVRLDSTLLSAVRRTSWRIALQSAIVAAVVTTVIYLVAGRR